MSLDVYLDRPRTIEHRCAHCGKIEVVQIGEDRVYDANITHNLGCMAEAAGIYQHLWRPEELGIKTAGELVEPLRCGLAILISDPAHFATFNASNGWGVYAHFVPFVREYLRACEENPDATVSVSR